VAIFAGDSERACREVHSHRNGVVPPGQMTRPEV
jgi:hypothetical protein